MNKTGITPLPGRALIRLEGFYDNAGRIVIPDMAKGRRKCEAILISFTPERKEKDRVDLSEALKANACVILKPYAGTHPFTRNGEQNLCIVSIGDIEAWSPTPLGVEHGQYADGAVPRCHFCGPARSAQSSNAMLMVEGPEGYYCPRCLKDKNGIVVDPDKVILTDEEERRMIV